MTIFFISYWSLNEGLTASTVFPGLQMLSEFEHIDRIVLFTIEHQKQDRNFKNVLPPIPKVEHVPIFSKDYKIHLATKVFDWWRIRSTILNKVKKEKPDVLLCQASMAGVLGYRASKKYGTRLIVQFFEPHADYMLESGVWSKSSPKYKFLIKGEQATKKHAEALVTGTNNYINHLVKVDGVPRENLHLVPCFVQFDKFAFDQQKRQDYRKRIGIADDTPVGVYLGKYGSIYYDEEAFQLYKETLDYFGGNFHLILLTPVDRQEIEGKLKAVGYPLDKVFIDCVAHEEVPAYLSAADFAFSTIKPAPVRKFCSPIKDGEYWSIGLPIIIPDGIGDDSDIIKEEGGGAVIDIYSKESIRAGLDIITKTIEAPNHREEIRKIALKHRHPDTQRKVYQKLFGKK